MAATYGEKADIVSKIAQRSERMKLFKDAIVHYVRSPPRLAGTCLCTSRHALTNMHTCTQGTYVHCMAVHVYKEDPRNNADVVLSKVNMARRIFTHRNLLEGELQRRDRKYVAPMISVPQQLAPWEWQEWLTMLRSQSIEPLLARFGLVRIESQRSHEMVSDRCAQAGRPCARPMHAARFFLGQGLHEHDERAALRCAENGVRHGLERHRQPQHQHRGPYHQQPQQPQLHGQHGHWKCAGRALSAWAGLRSSALLEQASRLAPGPTRLACKQFFFIFFTMEKTWMDTQAVG